ncbi:MAG: 50S ribosomal protein L18 [Patescibacteria group bacterium]
MDKQKNKIEIKNRRQARVRAKIFGTAKKPRLSVNRSLNYIYAQLIDDEAKKTIVGVHQKSLKLEKKTKTELAFEVGKETAKKALDKKIKECIFDRGGYKYHGRVKALAEGAREGGLKF